MDRRECADGKCYLISNVVVLLKFSENSGSLKEIQPRAINICNRQNGVYVRILSEVLMLALFHTFSVLQTFNSILRTSYLQLNIECHNTVNQLVPLLKILDAIKIYFLNCHNNEPVHEISNNVAF